ncbi:hypothetical protein pb186bvf_016401 [Paramecium bursaria]
MIILLLFVSVLCQKKPTVMDQIMEIFGEIIQNQDQDLQHQGQEIISILIADGLPLYQELDVIKQVMVSKLLKDIINDWATQGEEYKDEIKSAYEVFINMTRAQQNIVLTILSQKIKKQIEEQTNLDSQEFMQGLLAAIAEFKANPIDIEPLWHLPQVFDDPPNQNGGFVPPWGEKNHTNQNYSTNHTEPEMNKTLMYANIEEQFLDLVERNKSIYEIRQILQIFIDEKVRPDDQQQFKDFLENIIGDYQDKQRSANDQEKLVSEQQQEQQYIIYISVFVVVAFIIFAIFLIRRQMRIKNMQRSYRDPIQIPEQSLD